MPQTGGRTRKPKRRVVSTTGLSRAPGSDSRAVVKFWRGPGGTTSKEGWGVVNAIKKKGVSAARISPSDRKREGISKTEYSSYMSAARSIAKRTAGKRRSPNVYSTTMMKGKRTKSK